MSVSFLGTRVRLDLVFNDGNRSCLGFYYGNCQIQSGAEVSDIGITVVIGGLISATALNLIVLPVLYIYLRIEKPNSILEVISLPLLFSHWWVYSLRNDFKAQETIMNAKSGEITLRQVLNGTSDNKP